MIIKMVNGRNLSSNLSDTTMGRECARARDRDFSFVSKSRRAYYILLAACVCVCASSRTEIYIYTRSRQPPWCRKYYNSDVFFLLLPGRRGGRKAHYSTLLSSQNRSHPRPSSLLQQSDDCFPYVFVYTYNIYVCNTYPA